MRNNEVKLNVLTTMIETTNNPTDRNEIAVKLERARFEEILYWERKKRSLLRMILCVLVGILISITFPSLESLLVPHLRDNTLQRQSDLDLRAFDAPEQKHFP